MFVGSGSETELGRDSLVLLQPTGHGSTQAMRSEVGGTGIRGKRISSPLTQKGNESQLFDFK